MQQLSDTMTYVHNNTCLMRNYDEQHRHGETITTACMESTVN